MNEFIKKHAITGSSIAIAMGLQTFVFGNTDIQKLKEKVEQLSQQITKLEASTIHD